MERQQQDWTQDVSWDTDECHPAANPIQGEDADQGRKHVEDIVEARYPLRLSRVEPCNAENGWSVCIS